MQTMLDADDIHKHWKLAQEGLAKWRRESRESYGFAAAHQWEQDDLMKMIEEERPSITFDRIGVFLDAVSGMEINNRQEIKYLPVEEGDIAVNETLTNAAKYYENACGAPDEDSEAVRDALICGIGVTEMLMDYEKNPDGMIDTIRRDPLMTWYDPRATRRNLDDAQFIFYGQWVDEEEARKRWPDGNFSGVMPQNIPLTTDRAFLYSPDDEVVDFEGEHEGQVFILHYQCFKRGHQYKMIDPETGETVNLANEKQFQAASKMFQEVYGREPREKKDYVKLPKRTYYRAFVSGEDILEQMELPVDSFTFNFITYKRDRLERAWYGMVRTMKDPQRFANKWLSNITHIINSNAKGGAYAEENAFKDPRKAEEDWANPAPLILLKEGGINKIKERAAANYPAGLERLLMFGVDSMPFVTGLNLEILGLADRQQAGVVENQRRQSAFGILAPLFAAIREYRKNRGRLMLQMIQKFIPQGTLIKVVGSAGERWVPLLKDSLTYDVVVDQAPDSPDYKTKVWEAMGQIIPPMMKAGYPIPPEILKYSPLPADLAEKWTQWIKESGWMTPEHRAQMEKMQQTLQQLAKENMGLKEQNLTLKVDKSIEAMQLQAKIKDGEERNQVKIYQTDRENIERRIESIIEASKAMMEAKLQQNQAELSAKTADFNAQLKAFESVMKLAAESKKAEAQQPIVINTGEKKKSPKRKVKASKQSDGVWQIEWEDDGEKKTANAQKTGDGFEISEVL